MAGEGGGEEGSPKTRSVMGQGWRVSDGPGVEGEGLGLEDAGDGNTEGGMHWQTHM